ncbi:hypothetical protein Glove_276g32 [Diversispora epigaea]|uniref:Uncharacterized protein n=1 Tax=Diversispora epigaea TaxID=1348612 RepID=A0A397I973_9GLOM|nr:hypothetical protein Glove_276g32 [Diversispora epigaea]
MQNQTIIYFLEQIARLFSIHKNYPKPAAALPRLPNRDVKSRPKNKTEFTAQEKRVK